MARMSPAPGPDPAASSLPSALGAALDRVGDRWSLQVVEALLRGPLRYGELAGASQLALTPAAPVSPPPPARSGAAVAGTGAEVRL